MSLTINIGPNGGTEAFDLSDAEPFTEYRRPANALLYFGNNFATDNQLTMDGATWVLDGPGTQDRGLYSITLAPEPRSLFLLMPLVALVGLRWRHHWQRSAS